jgi:hypothetical protein
MSLCYDFEKWTMISLVSVAISLTVGLIILVGHEASGQSSAPFANCITYKDLNAVMLSMDEDCSEQQFNEAITHYKTNGYPNEGSYTDMLGEKSIELDTTEYYESKIK